MRMFRFLPLLALVLPAAAVAEDDAGEIVVQGEGLPLPPGTPAYGAVIVDRARLANSASNRIESVLSDIAGFQQFRRSDSRSANPSAQGATLRALGGNASSRTLVLLDGVPMADPFFGYIPFSALVPERLSLIRVTRGAGGGAFGAGAVAGTIELASAGREAMPALAASAFYGSRDATELSAGLATGVGGGFVTLSGRWDRGDGFQTTPFAQRGVATVPARYEGWSTALRAVAPLGDDIEIQARGLVFRDDRTLRFRGADSGSEGQDASVRLIARGPWQVDALAYLQLRNFSNVVVSSTSFRRSLDQRNTPSTGLGGKIELRPPLGDAHLLRFGADLRRASGDMFEDAYNASTGALTARRHAGGRQTTAGAFVEDDWTIGRLVLTGGARADHWSIAHGFFRARNAADLPTADNRFARRSGWEISGRAGALLRLSDAVALRGAGYTGFRLPTLNELYRPFVVFPITTQANAQLKPEKLKGVEAGLDLAPLPGATFGITAFYNRLGDAIANVTIGANLRQRRNVRAIVAKGVELTGAGRWGDVALTASYAYSHATVDAPGGAFDGLVPAQSPRHAASATLAWEPRRGPALSATLRYVARQYEDDLQVDALPHALTVDAVARLPLGGGFSLVARGENLFDETVVTRNVAGSMDLGTPRTLWIGVKFEG
ncbi:TonB-dependent receptor [Sphingomonas sp. C8-2]|jgi:iron complex outermembrane receptor protein|uniref:Iron complex outermembrane recepter protein n=1 Tax=Rhizorhabdus histidinilytica TaxID=439228 RepID=A0A1T5GW20_9SPHN|nr:TonB-dependent receptor [Rhizorhabdus histidinilytica]QEH77834.1 TonB-dependent receptor [Sphingomonas sp. C8-2]SKC12595.1 iron complex outermembrane recepter protein [Rhizorhabdus histidinilytica]